MYTCLSSCYVLMEYDMFSQQRHRMVNEILREELAAGVHALSIQVTGPLATSPTHSERVRYLLMTKKQKFLTELFVFCCVRLRLRSSGNQVKKQSPNHHHVWVAVQDNKKLPV